MKHQDRTWSIAVVGGGKSAARRTRLRRGLLAGGAALAAALAHWSAEPAAANDPNDILLGGTNPGSGTVATTTAINANVAAPGLSVNNSNGTAVGGAIQATTAGGFGISARSGAGAPLQFGNTGVIGAAEGATLPFDTSDRRGVYGSASGFGVHGQSATGDGVRGDATGSNPASAGVLGTSSLGPGVQGTSETAFGVQGLSTNAYGVSGNSTTQAGIWGSSNSNVGVLGTSTSGVGVNGVSSSSNGVNALSTSGIGIYASCSGGLAGRFDGNVLVNGNLTVSGSFPHTAAVASADGTLRRMYSPEAAEAYYEDVGQGSLVNGVGAVTLDPDFANVILGDTYHVFVTPRGDCNGLYISSQGPTGFEVRELRGGTSNVGFSYRIVARPRANPSPRLDRVTLSPAPAQPRLDHVEPLDVPARLRDLPTYRGGALGAGPGSVRDGQAPGSR
jgi:hypothetical protein